MTDAWSSVQLPALRLALGLGDQALEQRLRPALDATDDLRVVAQCLSADQVLAAIEAGAVDAVVLAWTLHRLTDLALDALERTRTPLILLAAEPTDERWLSRQALVVALDADVAAIRAALQHARGGRRLSRPQPIREPVPLLKAADRPAPEKTARIIALTGGAGSPGRTTVAINLAVALGAVAPTVLVEADFSAPSVAGYLDLDPTRNICPLAHAVRENPRAWGSALADELQPLARHNPSTVVLCGPPKREMRSSVPPAVIERLLIELAAAYHYVILDVGPEVLGPDTSAANHRTALAAADDLLLVSRSDLVGLWQARVTLQTLDRHLSVPSERIHLLLNRHDARHHHPPTEVAVHLGVPIARVIPADYRAVERAVADQQPLVFDQRSRAARTLLDLADDVHAGRGVSRSADRLPARAHGWWRRLSSWVAREPAVAHPPARPSQLRGSLENQRPRQERGAWSS